MTGPLGFSDAARRMSDTIRQAIVDGHRGRWMAFTLDEGRSDGVTYEHRREAVAAKRNAARDHAYIKIPWDDATARACEVMLQLARQTRDLGRDYQLIDPEVADQDWARDNRREAYPGDVRKLLFPPVNGRLPRLRRLRRSPGGIHLP